MAVFRVEKNSGYTVMSNNHLRNRNLSLKAKGLLSQMLSLPEDWDYTLQGLARINRESIDAIRQAIRELEQAGYIQRSRERDEKGRLRGADYVIFELPQPVPASVSPTLENPTLEDPTQENPTLENPMQLNKDKLITEKQKKEGLNSSTQKSDTRQSLFWCSFYFHCAVFYTSMVTALYVCGTILQTGLTWNTPLFGQLSLMTILCMQELMSGFIMMLFLIFYYFPLTFTINNSTIDDSKSWRRCYGINRFGHTRYCIGKTSKCL